VSTVYACIYESKNLPLPLDAGSVDIVRSHDGERLLEGRLIGVVKVDFP
jgi:hypothetical protein